MKLLFLRAGCLIAVAISGAMFVVILLNPDLLDHLPRCTDVWFYIVLFLFGWGLKSLRRIGLLLRFIWKGCCERIEKEVDLSDVETPPGKGQRVSIYDLAQELGENPSTISHWCQNLNISSKYLNVEQAERIRNYGIAVREGLEVK